MINELIMFLYKTLIVLCMVALSAFIYANVAEKVLLADLPYVSSVAKTDLPMQIEQIRAGQEPATDKEKYGFFGKPTILRLPRLDYALNLAISQKEDGLWIASNGVANIHTYESHKNGNIGDSVIFGLPNTGLLSATEVLVEGDRLMLDTDSGWRYNFKVSKRVTINRSETYLVSHSPYSKLVILRDKGDKLTVIEAQFVNILELENI